jgi:hypothetical protein
MKVKIRDINLHSSTRRMIEEAGKVIDTYDMPVTVRQIFYRLVAQGIIDNTFGEYKRLGKILTNGRYCGLLDWDKFTDEMRGFYKPDSYASIEEAIEDLKERYRRDRWEHSPYFIFVWVEKATMLNQCYPITQDYDVHLTAGRGWGSASQIWQTVKMISQKDGKEIRMLHFGDLDPSGWGMIGDIENRLSEFGLDVVLEHILLNEDDIGRYNLTPSYNVIVKEGTREERDKLQSDTRAKKFKERFGRLFQVEVEAMDPAELVRRLREGLDKYFEPKLHEEIWSQESKDISRIKLIGK